MKYYKRFYTEDKWTEVSKEHALDTLLTTYKDNSTTYEMLDQVWTIPCKFSEIRVVDEKKGEHTMKEFRKLNTFRQELIKDGQNIDWCHPFQTADEKYIIVQNEGNIAGMALEGKDIPESDYEKHIKIIAQTIDEDYNDYEGYTDMEIIKANAYKMTELGCRDCPYFWVCDALDLDDDESWEAINAMDRGLHQYICSFDDSEGNSYEVTQHSQNQKEAIRRVSLDFGIAQRKIKTEKNW